MVAEGLDCEIDFLGLLTAIGVSFSRLGKRAEMAKYRKRIAEYYKIHVNGKSPLLPGV